MKRRDFLKVSALGALTLLGTGGGLLETAAATPHIYNGDEKLSCKVARRINVETAALCQKYPDKFGFVAALPFSGRGR